MTTLIVRRPDGSTVEFVGLTSGTNAAEVNADTKALEVTVGGQWVATFARGHYTEARTVETADVPAPVDDAPRTATLGDIVRIRATGDAPKAFDGLLCRKSENGYTPLSNRPDGRGRSWFFWSDVEVLGRPDEAATPSVGDTVLVAAGARMEGAGVASFGPRPVVGTLTQERDSDGDVKVDVDGVDEWVTAYAVTVLK